MRRLVLVTVAVIIVAGLAAVGTVLPGRWSHRTAAAAWPIPTSWAGTGASRAAIENQRPGTSAWRLTQPGAPDAIEGWADHASAANGDSGATNSDTCPSNGDTDSAERNSCAADGYACPTHGYTSSTDCRTCAANRDPTPQTW